MTAPTPREVLWLPYYEQRTVEVVGQEWPSVIVEKWERNPIGETRFVESVTLTRREPLASDAELEAFLDDLYQRGVDTAPELHEALKRAGYRITRDEPTPAEDGEART